MVAVAPGRRCAGESVAPWDGDPVGVVVDDWEGRREALPEGVAVEKGGVGVPDREGLGVEEGERLPLGERENNRSPMSPKMA